MAIGPLGNVATPKLQFFVPGTNTPLSGGKLFTYAGGTTTKQATYTNDAQTPNTNPIILDANGQCVCFVDTTLKYDFTLSPSTDTDPPTNAYWTVQNMGYQEMIASFAPINSPTFTGVPKAPTAALGDSSTAIATTQFVQNSITSGISGVVQVPSVTGQSGKYLTNNGTTASWGTLPAISGASGAIVVGTVKIQWGSGTLPASGTTTATVSITFPAAFSGLPYAITVTASAGSGAFSAGGQLIVAATSQSASGFTAQGDGNTGFDAGTPGIVRATPFTWIAIGPA